MGRGAGVVRVSGCQRAVVVSLVVAVVDVLEVLREPEEEAVVAVCVEGEVCKCGFMCVRASVRSCIVHVCVCVCVSVCA